MLKNGLILAIFMIASTSQSAVIRWSCESMTNYKANPDLFLSFKGVNLAPPHERCFYASNEHDWIQAYPQIQKLKKTDIVAGVGSNSIWDLAVRLNAKKMFFVDWSKDPLIGQKFLIAPLIKIARTPADFLSLVSGVPLTPEINAAPLEKVFEYIDNFCSPQSPLAHMSIIRDMRQDYVKHTIERLNERPDITEEQVNFVSDYLTAYVNRSLDDFAENMNLGPFDSRQARMLARYYEYFQLRYHPLLVQKQLERSRLNPEILKDPFLTPLSSQAAFERFKHLFETAEYIQANIMETDGFTALKKMGDRTGLSTYTFYASNVLDFLKNLGQIDIPLDRAVYELGQRMRPLTEGGSPAQLINVEGLMFEHTVEAFTIYPQ